MSFGRYLLGLVELGLMIVPLAGGAWSVRTRLLPDVARSVARLAEVVMFSGALLAVAEILGSVGLFESWAMVLSCVLVGSAALVWGRRGQGQRGPASAERSAPGLPIPFVELIVATAGVALVTAKWATGMAQAAEVGITNSDSIWYHLPIAGRFAQTGSVTALHFLNGEALVTYYPANVPLLHAIGMLAFGRDVVSLVLNAAALAIALLSGWCIGQHWRQGPAGLLAVAVALSLPEMVQTMAGSAKDDAFALAFLLAAVAISLEVRGRVGLVLCGAAAGLALGSKLTMVVPVVVLGLGLTAIAGAPRLRAFTRFSVGALATGGFWYVRNLVAIGNPIPGLSRNLDWLGLASPVVPSYQRFGTTFSEFLFNNSAWHDVFLPGVNFAWGRAWPLVVVLASIGAMFAVARERGVERVAAATAVAIAVAFPFTPGSAYAVNVLGRTPTPDSLVFFFGFNLRYVVPALALGLALAPSIRVRGRPRTHWPLLISLGAALVLMQTGTAGTESWIGDHAGPAIAVAIVVAIAGVGYRVLRPWGWRFVAGVLVSMALVALAAWPVVTDYFDGRYGSDNLAQWANRHHGTRVALTGFPFQYDLLGSDLSNHVQYLGQRGDEGSFLPFRDCLDWRRALRAGRYKFVVVPVPGARTLGYDLSRWRLGLPNGEPPRAAPETDWTASDPHAHVVFRASDATIYAVDGPATSRGCAMDAARVNR